MKGNTFASKKSTETINTLMAQKEEPPDALSIKKSSVQLFSEIGDHDSTK
jgi:hypothetical protein